MNHWLQDAGVVPPRPEWYQNRYHEHLTRRMNGPKNNTSEVVRFRGLLRGILRENGLNITVNEIHDIIRTIGYDGPYSKNRITPMVRTVKADIERDLDDAKIVKLYEMHSSIEIAEMYGICTAHVIDRLRQNGVQIRSARDSKRIINERRAQYVNLMRKIKHDDTI